MVPEEIFDKLWIASRLAYRKYMQNVEDKRESVEWWTKEIKELINKKKKYDQSIRGCRAQSLEFYKKGEKRHQKYILQILSSSE